MYYTEDNQHTRWKTLYLPIKYILRGEKKKISIFQQQHNINKQTRNPATLEF